MAAAEAQAERVPDAIAQSPQLPVEQVRERLLQLVARPPCPDGVAAHECIDDRAPLPEGASPAEGVSWERWVVRSEPGALGQVPVLLARPADAEAQRRLPCVFVLHGTLHRKEDFADHLSRYAKKGFVAVCFDLRYRGERGELEDYHASIVRAFRQNHGGPEAEAPGPGDEHPFMYDGVWDLMRVIDMVVARPDVDASRIGATGVSLGGMHAWLGAAADPRIAAAAPAIGVQSYLYAVEKEVWQGRVDSIRPVFEAIAQDVNGPGGAITTEVVEKTWRRVCPGILGEIDAPSSLRCIAPRPLLVINGEKDPRCPIEGVRLAMREAEAEYRRMGAPPGAITLHVAEGVEHEVTPAMWQAIDDFLVEHLGAGSASAQAPQSRL